MEAARQSDVEVARFRRALIAHKDGDPLLKVVDELSRQAKALER